MKRATLSITLVLCFSNVALFSPLKIATAQSQTISIAIVNFQDDTGANAPTDLGQRLAQDLQQKIAIGYKDVLPRLVGGVDSAAVKSMPLDQLAALAKQSGAKFVIRGGLLAFIPEPAGSDSKVTVQLYADIISADNATVVTTVRAEGSAPQIGAAPQLSILDVKSGQFSSSGVGQAFAGAIAQLADSIHQALTNGNVTTTINTQSTTSTDTSQNASQGDAAKSAEIDAELQQLIAQASTLLSNSTNPNDPNVIAAGQALQALKSALETKANLMQSGKDTSQADQDIAAQRQALQAVIAQLTSQAATASSTGTVTTTNIQQPAEAKKGFLQSLDDLAGQALTLLQNIQQMRTAVQNLTESSGGLQFSQSNGTGVPGNSGVTEQQLGECNGVVTDQNGAAISNAQVLDQTSGTSTSTDNNGQYDLKGLLSNQIAVINVTASGKTITSQTPITAGQLATLDFQFKPDESGGIRRPIILPPTVILNPPAGSKVGGLKGIVRDPQGRPVARALVLLKGFAFARTDSQGQFQFLNVPAGVQQLSVNQSGLITKTTQLQIDAAKTATAQLQFSANDRIPPPTKTLMFQPSSGATVSGTVIDAKNLPVPGAKISVLQGTSAVAVFTGPNGAFVLNSVRPGQYRMIASKAGYDPSLQNVTFNQGKSASIQFRLTAQNSPAVARLLNTQPKPRTADTEANSGRKNSRDAEKMATVGSLAGQVTDSKTGRPIAGAIVSVSNQQRTQTNSSGAFAFTNMPMGKYEITISKPGYTGFQGTISIQPGKISRANLALQPKSTTPLPSRRP